MEKFTSKQERLMEKARDLKNKVLKKVTALQVFRGVKKGGEQIIKDSDKVVIFKMDNGQEFITNGYFMIKKGYDKAMDEMLVKFADKVVVMEQKMKTFYTGCESDYAMVTNADVRVFNTLLTTEKTTMIIKNDAMDNYHAYVNSYYYRYFEKKVSKMGVSNNVNPIVMFDDNDEFVGCVLPVRMTMDGKKEFENTLTLEEFFEGEKIIKEHRETLLVEIIENNTDECLEKSVADTERRKKEFDGFIASELKVIKNIDGYYEVGYELEGINKLYTHISVYGTRDYGHYDYFLNKPDTKRLAERMLEKIQEELAKNTKEKVENEMNKKQLKEEEQMKKSMDSINDTIEEFGWTVMNILVNIKEENCIGAVIENQYGKLKLEGLYAGADKGNESMELAKKLANYYEVEIIDANGIDIHDLEEEKILEQLSELASPEMLVAIADKLGLPSLDEEVSPEPTTEDVVEWQGLEKIKNNPTTKVEFVTVDEIEVGDIIKKLRNDEICKVVEVQQGWDYNRQESEITLHCKFWSDEKQNEGDYVVSCHVSDEEIFKRFIVEEKEEKEVEIKTMDYDTTLPIGTVVGFRYDEYENDVLVEKKILTGKIVYIFDDYAGKYNIKTNDGNIHLVHNSDIVTWEEPLEWQGLEKTEKDELDILIEEFDETVEEIEQLEINQAIGMEVDKKLLEKLNRKLFKIQCAIEKTGKVYIVRHTSRVLDTPDSIAIFRELEQAKQFMKSSEKTLEILGLFTNEHGRLIPVDEDEEKLISEIKEITKRLDGIAKDVEIYDGYYDYTLKNGCTLRLFTDEPNPICIALEIFDSSGMFYMRKVGDENIHKYIDKVEKAQDVLVYEKYGLDDYINCETGNVVIDVKDMKNKGNIFGTPLEEVIDKLLKENKEFEMKLFNENYIKEPHYMIFRKGEIKNE